MRVYRILAGPEPRRSDFVSLASQGRPVPRTAPEVLQRKWGAISTFTTLELARKRAEDKDLGRWWAALELPADVEVEEDKPHPLGRHVSIYGQTPEQLLGHVVEIGPFESEAGVE